jgi:actin related protein 2/3 complex subunit 5
MSKNTASNKFRTVDVDQYNEDNFKDDDGEVVQEKKSGLSSSEVEALIQKGHNADALKAVLSSAPIGNKSQDEKVSPGKICDIGNLIMTPL